MNFLRLRNQVIDEYDDEDLATLVVVAMSILLTTKVTKKDLVIRGRFTSKINKKTHDLLWEYKEDEIQLAISIRDAWNEYLCRWEMQGIGGCTYATLKEIVDK